MLKKLLILVFGLLLLAGCSSSTPSPELTPLEAQDALWLFLYDEVDEIPSEKKVSGGSNAEEHFLGIVSSFRYLRILEPPSYRDDGWWDVSGPGFMPNNVGAYDPYARRWRVNDATLEVEPTSPAAKAFLEVMRTWQ